jgi:sporulation protein YqfC
MDYKFYKAKETIAEKLDIPRDIVMNLPKITVTGDNEIIIENHKGVILFEERQVKINSTIGMIEINGSRFEVLFMGGNTLTLSGKFKSITYVGND